MRPKAKKDPLLQLEQDLLKAKIRLADSERRLDLVKKGLNPDEEIPGYSDFD